jgi:hypothetical protein
MGAVVALGVAVGVAGCATAPEEISAEDSAIALGKSLVMQSVPIGGLAVQALVSAGDGEDRGSYRYKSQLFCQTNSQAVANIRQKFAILCGRKGAEFDGQFCVRPDGADRVLFSAQLESQGTGSCYRLYVSEAVTVGSPDYLQFLVSKAGYQTAEAKAGKTAAQQAAANDARARIQAETRAQQAREQARLQAELPMMKKRGTKVCRIDGQQTFVGFVEDFTDEKLKVLVTQGFMTNTPNIGLRVEPGTLTWDPFIAWRLC